MLTLCDVRGALWPRTAALHAQALLEAEVEVNAAAPAEVKLWTELQQWAQEREERLSHKMYAALPDAAANAWVEWLEALQEKVRDARVADGNDKERIRRAARIIVSWLPDKQNQRECWLT